MNKGQINLKKQSQLHNVIGKLLNDFNVPKGIVKSFYNDLFVINEQTLINNKLSLLSLNERMKINERFKQIELRGHLYSENSIYCYSVNIPPYKFIIVYPADLEQPIKISQINNCK